MIGFVSSSTTSNFHNKILWQEILRGKKKKKTDLVSENSDKCLRPTIGNEWRGKDRDRVSFISLSLSPMSICKEKMAKKVVDIEMGFDSGTLENKIRIK